MKTISTASINKLRHAMPWLLRYPFERTRSFWSRKPEGERYVVFTIANHFEPGWKAAGVHDLDIQLRRVDEHYNLARRIGEAVRDANGTKFRHTNFFPAEQYDHRLIEKLAAMQAEGLGDVEIHLHHGVDGPDTPENLRAVLTDFRDILAEEHKCLSRLEGCRKPMYAFVHGNLALANSRKGAYCGVDCEMQILQETGCYVT